MNACELKSLERKIAFELSVNDILSLVSGKKIAKVL